MIFGRRLAGAGPVAPSLCVLPSTAPGACTLAAAATDPKRNVRRLVDTTHSLRSLHCEVSKTACSRGSATDGLFGHARAVRKSSSWLTTEHGASLRS